MSGENENKPGNVATKIDDAAAFFEQMDAKRPESPKKSSPPVAASSPAQAASSFDDLFAKNPAPVAAKSAPPPSPPLQRSAAPAPAVVTPTPSENEFDEDRYPDVPDLVPTRLGPRTKQRLDETVREDAPSAPRRARPPERTQKPSFLSALGICMAVLLLVAVGFGVYDYKKGGFVSTLLTRGGYVAKQVPNSLPATGAAPANSTLGSAVQAISPQLASAGDKAAPAVPALVLQHADVGNTAATPAVAATVGKPDTNHPVDTAKLKLTGAGQGEDKFDEQMAVMRKEQDDMKSEIAEIKRLVLAMGSVSKAKARVVEFNEPKVESVEIETAPTKKRKRKKTDAPQVYKVAETAVAVYVEPAKVSPAAIEVAPTPASKTSGLSVTLDVSRAQTPVATSAHLLGISGDVAFVQLPNSRRTVRVGDDVEGYGSVTEISDSREVIRFGNGKEIGFRQ